MALICLLVYLYTIIMHIFCLFYHLLSLCVERDEGTKKHKKRKKKREAVREREAAQMLERKSESDEALVLINVNVGVKSRREGKEEELQ